jgi:hypothetical protein
MIDDVKMSGFTVLFIGVGLLIFTFYTAFQFLVGVQGIAPPGDFVGIFGESLSPLITYAIRALYLGIMGWVGSILTRRGVQIIISPPKEGKTEKDVKGKEDAAKTSTSQ